MLEVISNAEKWKETFEESSPKKQFEIIQETLQQELSGSFIEQTGLSTYILEVRDYLFANNLFKDIFSLILLLKEKHQKIFDEIFMYFENIAIQYYLFNDEIENVASSLKSFTISPEKSIDEILIIINDLVLNGFDDLAIGLINSTFDKIKNSQEKIGSAEYEFGNIIFNKIINNHYKKLKEGQDSNLKDFIPEFNKIGFEGGEFMVNEINSCLKDENILPDLLEKEFKHDRETQLRKLSWQFFKYMFDNKNVNFSCSHLIWYGFLKFLSDFKKKPNPPEKFFKFKLERLDSFIAELLGGFFSLQQNIGLAILWGIPYIYDFLYLNKIISKELYNRIQANVSLLKEDVINAMIDDLWVYEFVHRWEKPDCISAEEFKDECEEFISSFIEKPLSDEIEKDNIMELFDEEPHENCGAKLFLDAGLNDLENTKVDKEES